MVQEVVEMNQDNFHSTFMLMFLETIVLCLCACKVHLGSSINKCCINRQQQVGIMSLKIQ